MFVSDLKKRFYDAEFYSIQRFLILFLAKWNRFDAIVFDKFNYQFESIKLGLIPRKRTKNK